MIIDIPEWVCHGHSDGISSIDVHPNGRRLVTSGSSPQLKIWNLLPILDAAAENDPNVPKLLAMLSEHQSDAGVQIARFNHSGSILASGGSDNIVLLYKLSAAAATATLGSTWVNKENWRPVGNLRGPSLDITGLSWSKDDKQLATCAMDGSIHIYSISPEGQGSQVHTIRNQHYGWVKGIAFDPVGRYLSTQGRNGVKVWDLQKDWALVQHMKQPFEKAPEAAFRLSLTWSPDGDLLIAPNGFSSGQPTIVVFKRQEWDADHLVGHRSSVIAAAANPKLFHPSKAMLAARLHHAQQMRETGQLAADVAEKLAADPALEGFAEDVVMTVMACGSNDKTCTVWGTEMPLPMANITQVHSGPVTDFCWTPDGYTVIACSSDDSVSVLRFSEQELGRSLTDAELHEYMKKVYGGAAAGAAAADAAVIQDPELAMLAAAAAPPQPVATVAAAAAPKRVAPQQLGTPAAACTQATAAGGGSGNGMLERRIMPTGAGIISGTLQQQQQATAAAAAAGKKQLNPAAARSTAANSNRQIVPAAAGGPAAGVQQQQQLARPVVRRAAGGWPLGIPAVQSLLQVQTAVVPSGTVVLTAKNSGGGAAAVAEVSLSITQGLRPETVWTDKLQGQVVAITGSAMLSAAATANGLLHIWRSCGNMQLPPLALGCPAMSLQMHGDWQIQVVGADGDFYLLNFYNGTRCMAPTPTANITPLLTASPPGTTLREAWISGTPQQQPASCAHMATLTDGSGWMFHNKLGLWMQLQPGVHEHHSIPLPRVRTAVLSADLDKLRQAAAEAAAASLRPQPQAAAAASTFRRRGAEQQMLAAQLLGDAGEYQRWLVLLVTALCDNNEQGRLKELAQDMLGPERWTPEMGDVPWSPTILGLNKRDLLGSIVVPTLARRGLKLSTEIRDCLVLARQHVDQYHHQQQQQHLLGVQRLQPQAMQMDLPAPQQTMQAFQQQQHRAGMAFTQQQQQPQQQQQVMLQPSGLPNGLGHAAGAEAAAAGMNGVPSQADQLQQQWQHQQQQPQQVQDVDMMEGSGSGQPVAAGSGVGAAATAAAAAAPGLQPRRIQPQVLSPSEPHRQQQQQQRLGHHAGEDAAASGTGRPPLQQVQMGQQQGQQQQQQADKLAPRARSAEDAAAGGQVEQQG